MTSISAPVLFRSRQAQPQVRNRRAGWPPADAQRTWGQRPTGGQRPAGAAHEAVAGGELPHARNVLAVTAAPGQESADLGGLLYALHRSGARLGLLCLTRGEASPLNSTCGRLEAIRPWEVQLAATVLGISSVMVASYPHGGLCRYPMAELTERVRRAIREHAADLLVVSDPVPGDPDGAAAAAAARAAAVQEGVPAVARTGPAAAGGWTIDLEGDAAAARGLQKSAAAAHASQSAALPQVQHRLDLADGREHLRWLVSPAAAIRPG